MQKLSKHRRNAAIGILAVAITGIVFSSLLLINNPLNPGTAPGNTLEAEPGNTLEAEPGEKPLLTEFGDFQCPHCAKFALNILPALEHDLIETGTIRFEYRHYPFLGPESFDAAEASECARDQGEFDEYHLELYRLTSRGKSHTPELLQETAEEMDLDPTAFDQCLRSGVKRARVLEDREYGRTLGVRGTPTLFIDGRTILWNNYPDLREKVRRIAEEKQSRAPRPAE